MESERIEKMVHHMRGLFPSQQISFNAVIDTWKQDQFLLNANASDAIKAMSLVEELGKFPSLVEFRNMIRKASAPPAQEVECDRCNGSGWDTGQDLMLLDATTTPATYKVMRWQYLQTYRGHEYSYAKPCSHIR